MDELVDEHLERLARVAEHLGERLEPRDVAVVVGAEHVDEAVEAARVLPADVGGVGGEVRRRAVRAHEHAVLLVAVRARPRPERAVVLVGVEQRDRLGDLGLDLALRAHESKWMRKRSSVASIRSSIARHRVARRARELGDVVAVVAVLGRLLAAPHRVDRRAEALHLRAGVVVVVLALDRVAGELEQARDGVAVGAVPAQARP